MVIGPGPKRGFSALLGPRTDLAAADIEAALSEATFRGVRTVAERDGLVFVEGGKR
jgi:hypothetical protein